MYFFYFLKHASKTFFGIADEVLIISNTMQFQHHATSSMVCSRLQAVFNGFEHLINCKQDKCSNKFDVLRVAWNCHFCSSTFENRFALAQHYRRKHPLFNSKSTLIVSQYQSNFKLARKHLQIKKSKTIALKKTKLNKTSAVFPCRICTSKTDSFFGLQLHYRQMHNVKLQKSEQMSIEFLLHLDPQENNLHS